MEQLLDDNGKTPPDVKLHVYAGNIVDIQFIFDREIGATSTIHLTPDWKHLPYSVNLPMYLHHVDRPPQMDLMIKLAGKLGQGFPYVRVDFYLCGGKVFFSEMTFYPAAGLVPYKPAEWDQRLGRQLDLKGIYDAEYFGNLSDKVLLDITSEAAERPLCSTVT